MRDARNLYPQLCVLLIVWLWSSCGFSQTTLVSVESVKKANSTLVIANNRSRIPLTLSLNLVRSSNIASSASWPIVRYIAPGQTLELVEISAFNKQQRYEFFYKFNYVIGSPVAQHDPTAKYRLPFISEQPVFVSQAPDGPIFSHNAVSNKNAIDLVMPISTPIVAARSGYVIENVNQFADNGLAKPEFVDKANFVRVLHDDGTWAEYIHLKQYSSHVSPGQRIEAGMVIGLSGNSGFSTEPHLHFHLQKNANGIIVSLPIEFWHSIKGKITPRYHTWLVPEKNTSTTTIPTKKLKECVRKDSIIDDTVLKCMKQT
ncbi:M23 family metallopeptidase [Undibacterium sp. WLHG33]|uniref:M23 family metallopeptidase n=1 Tax=Undibacterium sp. WLHG33 TaxID=3412482 RepID=UPI003C2C5704